MAESKQFSCHDSAYKLIILFFSGLLEHNLVVASKSTLLGKGEISIIPVKYFSDSSISLLTNDAVSTSLPDGLQQIQSVCPDVRRKVMYFYEESTASIYRISNFTLKVELPSSFQNIYTGVSRGKVRIAVDYITGNIYWTEPSFKTVVIQSTADNSLKSHTLITKGIGFPLGLAVDPVNRSV